MARPVKQEVDYFPHYCDHGKVLFILENHYKNDGYAVFYKLEELLGKTEGHCYDCSRVENWEYLLSRMCAGEEIVLGVIEKLAAMGVIDSVLWIDHKKIWMESFVQSISDVYARRKHNIPVKPDLCTQKTPQNAVSNNNNPQSKGKESKVNNNKTPPDGGALSDFNLFWEAYPKHNYKKAALKEWLKIPNKPAIEIILKAINAQKSNKTALKAAKEFVPEWPDPHRWIRNERWNDEITPPKEANGSQSPYVACPRCGAEVLHDQFVEIAGVKYCEKCPKAQQYRKDMAAQQYGKITNMAAGR